MDKVADKIIQKYQTSTCEQLYLSKAQEQPPSPEEQKAVPAYGANGVYYRVVPVS